MKMKKLFLMFALAAISVLSASAQSVYDYQVTDDLGNEVSLEQYKGKVLLIVNTATRCGFTPQYKELEALYEKYSDKGFAVLDFPCNQFGQQAPGTIGEIHQFCTANFNITFPQFDKIEVNGDHEHPLYTFLKASKGFAGFNLEDRIGKMLDERFKQQDPDYAKNTDIKWNFTKFLIGKDGKVVKRFEPTATANDMEPDINALLENGCCKGEGESCCKQ